jgi:putative pyruvate formate lyase activating enzyme
VTSPSYLRLHRSGELVERIEDAIQMLHFCELCPHRCQVNRQDGERGICGMGAEPKISSWTLHAWEEPPISGARGSGTIFFSGCTGRCTFCQNYPISQFGHGDLVSVQRLAAMMVELQTRGAHNINLVTPTHFMPQILAALPYAIEQGLRLPLVYNTSGYERVEALRSLKGIIDVWLPDAKYADDEVALRLSGLPQYVKVNRAALLEIYDQVGDRMVLDGEGIAQRGMIVRHLVLPGRLAGTAAVVRWIAENLSPRVHISLMDQYFPAHLAGSDSLLKRKLQSEEYEEALDALEAAGLENGWRQDTVECTYDS